MKKIIPKIAWKDAAVFAESVQTIKQHMIGVATIYEAAQKSGLMSGIISPLYPKARVVGQALTIQMPAHDNLVLHDVGKFCSPGDVLVVVPDRPSLDGVMGDLLARYFKRWGIAGAVFQTGCRDSAELEAMDFSTWCVQVYAGGTTKKGVADVNGMVRCGEVQVFAGDLIVGDRDGVVSIPRHMVGEVVKAALDRENKEANKRERIDAGEHSMDINGWRSTMDSLMEIHEVMRDAQDGTADRSKARA